jgi:hypothetical protein
MSFTDVLATANEVIENHLMDDHFVDGIPVRGIFDLDEAETPGGFIPAPTLTVTLEQSKKIDEGADFSHDDKDYVIGKRRPDDEGFIELELKRA